MMKSLLIKNGTIVTASDTFVADIFVEDGCIVQIGLLSQMGEQTSEADTCIDASGKYVIPGGIDVHTHLDMPLGDISSVDDFEIGTIAAACGGTTTIIDYAAQSRGESMEQGLETWLKKAEDKAVIDYGFHMTLSEFTDRTLQDMERMVALGVCSFKVFTAYPDRLMLDDASIFRVLKKSKELGALVCAHAENGYVIDVLIREALAAGHTAPKYHALTRPPAGEGESETIFSGNFRVVRIDRIGGGSRLQCSIDVAVEEVRQHQGLQCPRILGIELNCALCSFKSQHQRLRRLRHVQSILEADLVQIGQRKQCP